MAQPALPALLVSGTITIRGNVDPDSPEGSESLDDLDSALELGLLAVKANLEEKFASLGLSIVVGA